MLSLAGLSFPDKELLETLEWGLACLRAMLKALVRESCDMTVLEAVVSALHEQQGFSGYRLAPLENLTPFGH